MQGEQTNEYTKVNTSLFLRTGKVVIDGMLWTVNLPGAKTTVRLSRDKRRSKLLEQKIENNTASEAEYDELDAIEEYFFDTLRNMFKDGTKDNSQVTKWMDETPLYVILATFEEVQKQAERKRE